MLKPARGAPPDLQEGAWVRVKDGWLTVRAQPDSKEELDSWGADVLASLQETSAGGGIAHGIAQEAASAGLLEEYEVFPVYPICKQGHCAEDCEQFARFVVFAEEHLRHGNRLVVHCRQGLHRSGVAIYLLLREIEVAPKECLSMMEKMRPVMHGEFLRRTRNRWLCNKAENIFADTRFKHAVAFWGRPLG